MGNSESSYNNSNNREKIYYKKKYNWVPSYPLLEYDLISLNNLDKLINNFEDNKSKYIDLRVNCPPVLDIGLIPINPIATVSSMLNYLLRKNQLPIFPPSRLFIYQNCGYFPEIQSILSFDIIFDSITFLPSIIY